jgi:hypothetical protein
MVDVGLTQVIVKRLNKDSRRRAKPHGSIDHYYRGIRLRYNWPYRIRVCFFSLFLLSIGCALYLVPGVFSDESPIVGYIMKIAWLGIIAVAILAPIQACRDFVVVNDEGIMKSDLFGRKTQLKWNQVSNFVIKLDANDLIFVSGEKTKLKMSLCYDGWQDFTEMSAKRLNQVLYSQFYLTMWRVYGDTWIKEKRTNKASVL